jgi:RND family efflux transporter MFP subunit
MASFLEIPSRRAGPSLLRLRRAADQVADEGEVAEAITRLPTWRRVMLVGLLALAGIGLATALFIQRRAAWLPRVRLARATRGHIAQSVPAVTDGRVTPASELTLRSEGPGRVAKLLVEPGDFVAAGDALLVLEAESLDRAVRAAATSYEVGRAGAAEAALRAQVARRAARRTRELVSSGSLALVEDENKGYEAEALAQVAAQARARVAGLRAELEAARRAKDRGVITAPISGLVTAVMAVAGENVTPGAPLLGLADVSKLHVASQVDESDAARIGLAMPVELRFPGNDGPPLRGKITRLAPRVSDTPQGSRVLGFDVSLPEGRTWRLGTSTEVDVITDEREGALLVPLSALVTHGTGRRVYVFADGRALPRDVETGLSDLVRIEIVRGLSAGERVIENPAEAGLSGAGEVQIEAGGAGGR